jgi:hypothetical protein
MSLAAAAGSILPRQRASSGPSQQTLPEPQATLYDNLLCQRLLEGIKPRTLKAVPIDSATSITFSAILCRALCEFAL